MQPNQPFQPYTPPPAVPAPPKKRRPWILIVSLAVCGILLLASLVFGIWAFTSRKDYKNNSDKKAAAAAAVATQQEGSRKDTEFVEKEKNPLKKYLGPAAFGSLDVSYPKTWSAYISESGQASTPIDGYFHPNFVPDTKGGTAFALRLEVTSQTYDQEMKQFEGKVKAGKLKVTAYSPKNVPGVTGSRVEGEINPGQQGVMILIPLRDRTIKISTQSQQFLGDFNNIVLENFKFSP